MGLTVNVGLLPVRGGGSFPTFPACIVIQQVGIIIKAL